MPALALLKLFHWKPPNTIDEAFLVLIFLLVSIAVGGILGGLLNLFRTAPQFYESSAADSARQEDKNIKRADVKGGALAGPILIGGSMLASSLGLMGRPITIPGWLVDDGSQVNAPHLVPAVIIGCVAILPHLFFLWQKRCWPSQLPMRSGTFTRQERPPSVRPAILCLIFMIIGLGVGLKYEVTVDTHLDSYAMDSLTLRIPRNYVYSFDRRNLFGQTEIVVRTLIPNFSPHTAANDEAFRSRRFGKTITVILDSPSETPTAKIPFLAGPGNEAFQKGKMDCLPPGGGQCQLLHQMDIDGQPINVTLLSADSSAKFLPLMLQKLEQLISSWAQS